ncbi:hypothetical protein G6F62_005534 [Rhizopus arrhizus]|nr:hypothetical protein G6F62_005534 [Rhizopus arrhizus]KAG1394984.1 hypothetical protein G6F60_010518 [Rhizopus arrhizus]
MMDDIQQLYNEYNRNTADAINSIDSVNKASKKPNLSEYISAVFFDDTIYEAAASSGDDEQSCNEEVDDVNGNFDETNTEYKRLNMLAKVESAPFEGGKLRHSTSDQLFINKRKAVNSKSLDNGKHTAAESLEISIVNKKKPLKRPED